jgi:hypothetical protein
VDTDAKKIASFKRELSPKLMKSMGNSKCITFNEFISDALTQENNDKIYAASKTCKRNFEQVLLRLRLWWCPKLNIVHLLPASGTTHLRRRTRLRLVFARGTRFLYQRILLGRVVPTFCHLTGCARIATSLVTGLTVSLSSQAELSGKHPSGACSLYYC